MSGTRPPPGPPPGPLRRIGLGLLSALLVAVAAHGAVWWWGTGEIEDRLAATLAAPAPGWSASVGPPRRAGWPFAARVEAPSLVVLSPGGPEQSLRWQAERLVVALEFARPRTLVLAVEGAQALQLGTAAPMPARAALMRAEVPLEPGVPARSATLAVADLVADPPAGRLAIARLDLAVETRPAALQGESAAILTVAARRIALPPGRPWLLGPAIETLAWDLALSGPVPPAGDPAARDLAARAEAWRDGGGTLTLRRLELAWGEVTLTGSATLALDARLQPMGTGTARLAGHDAALRALATAGALSPRSAAAAGAVLSLLARPQPGGGPPAVEAPLGLQDRTLSLGRIPLLRLPELVWRPPS